METYIRYEGTAEVWLYQGKGAWHFITLPAEWTAGIKDMGSGFSSPWGSVPVEATIGRTRWRTSVFPDKKRGAYLLPIKALVRAKEGLAPGDRVTVIIDLSP